MALYTEKCVTLPKPSPAEILTNIWAADGYLASLETRKDGVLYRLRACLDQAGLRRLRILEFLGPNVNRAALPGS